MGKHNPIGVGSYTADDDWLASYGVPDQGFQRVTALAHQKVEIYQHSSNKHPRHGNCTYACGKWNPQSRNSFTRYKQAHDQLNSAN